MPFNPAQLEDFVRQRAPEIARDITTAAQQSRNEADLVATIEPILEKFAKHFDVTLHLDRERTLINGRADAVYNRFVIEYEPPRSLRKEKGARTNQHAIEQVQHYVEGLERLDRHKKERLAGAVLDGSFFIFVRYRDEHWHIDDPLPVNTHSTETFLRYLLSLSTELALTPENLQRDFGENSNTARQVVPALYTALCSTRHPKVLILYEQWKRQFGEITGYEKGSDQLDLAGLCKSYAIKDKAPQAERLFFTLHTYYATFIKLLAVQVAQYYLMPKVGSGLAAVANLDSVALQSYLAKMERGGVFADFGIKNFLEGDFFGWYLEIWDEWPSPQPSPGTPGEGAPLQEAIRRLIGDLGNYSLVTLDVDPEETRDLLKQLYQNLMPKKLRHALGEYYTPDWLAERLLNQLGYDGNPARRLLDPACGSGTFLVLAIKRARQYIEDKMLPVGQALEQILTNIVGYDLNPLAVISARTNYLLALGELLSERKGEINIPVFLCDSILTPSQGADLFTQSGYSFNTAVGRFTVPRALVSAARIERFAELLEECVEVKLAPAQFRARLAGIFGDLPDDQASLALTLYAQLRELDQQGVNGIWARIIKNAFAPLFQGRFDYVAGNPPWVNWESLPEDYRQATMALWQYYGLYVYQGQLGKMREGKKDISALMTYVAIDRYLHVGGHLGFLITQSVFKTASASQGFRRFCLGDGTPLGVLQVDDMAELKPFEGAANRTAIVILERDRETRYPVPYNLWFKPAGGSTIAEDLTLEEIYRDKIASSRRFVARPVDEADPTSPWITGRPQALQAIQKVLGASDYGAREGANTGGANAVYWVEIISRRPDGLVVVTNLTEGAKRQVESVQAALEPDLLYPLLRGRDVQRWRADPTAYMLVVQDREKQREGMSEIAMQVRYPKTYSYLVRFRDALVGRPDRKYYPEGSPFYTLRNVADYTFSPYKVVWREVSHRLDAAVAEQAPDTSKCAIPDHTLILIPCQQAEEAHFVCAALNSSPSRFVVQNYIVLHPDPHILGRVCIPRYDAANATHRELAFLSRAAHAATAAGEAVRVQEIEAEVDRLAAQLWGLTDEELEEIRESLAELG